MMINVLMGQDVVGDSGSLRDVGNAVLLVNVQLEKHAGDFSLFSPIPIVTSKQGCIKLKKFRPSSAHLS